MCDAPATARVGLGGGAAIGKGTRRTILRRRHVLEWSEGCRLLRRKRRSREAWRAIPRSLWAKWTRCGMVVQGEMRSYANVVRSVIFVGMNTLGRYRVSSWINAVVVWDAFAWRTKLSFSRRRPLQSALFRGLARRARELSAEGLVPAARRQHRLHRQVRRYCGLPQHALVTTTTGQGEKHRQSISVATP